MNLNRKTIVAMLPLVAVLSVSGCSVDISGYEQAGSPDRLAVEDFPSSTLCQEGQITQQFSDSIMNFIRVDSKVMNKDKALTDSLDAASQVCGDNVKAPIIEYTAVVLNNVGMNAGLRYDRNIPADINSNIGTLNHKELSEIPAGHSNPEKAMELSLASWDRTGGDGLPLPAASDEVKATWVTAMLQGKNLQEYTGLDPRSLTYLLRNAHDEVASIKGER